MSQTIPARYRKFRCVIGLRKPMGDTQGVLVFKTKLLRSLIKNSSTLASFVAINVF